MREAENDAVRGCRLINTVRVALQGHMIYKYAVLHVHHNSSLTLGTLIDIC